jgi:hypothetical protein
VTTNFTVAAAATIGCFVVAGCASPADPHTVSTQSGANNPAASTVTATAIPAPASKTTSTQSGANNPAASTVTATAIPAPASKTTSTAPASAGSAADMMSLIPTPGNNRRTDGPDSIQENGIHERFLATGSTTDVMNSFKAAPEANGWTVTVANAGGGGWRWRRHLYRYQRRSGRRLHRRRPRQHQ